MKKIVYTFLLLSITTLNIYAQQGWFWQNPLPQGNYLNNIIFTDLNTGYCTGYNGMILKSTNAGLNYFILENNITENLTSICFRDHLTGYLGTDNGVVYKTNNGGSNFTGTYTGVPDMISSIIFLNEHTGILVSRHENSRSKLLKTTNAGLNWNYTSGIPDSACIYNIAAASENVLYCCGERIQSQFARLYRSTDRGSNWEFVPVALNGGLCGVHFLNEQTGFVSQFRYGQKFFRTTNGCNSWDTLGNYAPEEFSFLNDQTGFAYGYYSNGIIYKTTNTGLNWDSTGNTVSGIGNVYFRSVNDWFKVGGSSIYTTSNSGANWNEISSGFNDYFDDIEFLNPNTGFIAANSGKVYKTTNSGNNWIGYAVDNNGVNCIDFINDFTGFAGTNWSKIAKTTNGGLNWNVKIIDSLMGESLTGISIPSNDTGYAVGKNGSNLKTTNGGINWQVSKLPNTLYMDDICFLNNTTGYCAGREDRGVIRKTVNGGLNWVTYNFDSVFYFTDLHFVNTELGFAVGNKVYNIGFIVRTTNGGTTWDHTYLPGTYLLSSVYFVNENVGYAGADGVSYKTTNGGNNWFGIRTKSPDLHGIYFINENTGYAVGLNGTIIKTTNGGGEPIGIEPISNTIPKEFRLYQNYPNPFNPVTKVKFSIPVSTQTDHVNIYIYDVAGREVKSYSFGSLKAGIYSVEFDGSELASGVYFYQLVSVNFSQTRKMVLIK